MKTLDELGLQYETDKASNGHNYLQFYERFLEPLRDKPITLVEAGVGGYEYPDRGGESLRMWRQYFHNPHAYIAGFDLHDKSGVSILGVHILKGSQTDREFLETNFGYGPYDDVPDKPYIDIFIDDASHVNPLSIETFKIMFPLVKPGGIYIWEDIHTSYWVEGYRGLPDPDVNNYMNNYRPPHESTAATFLHRLQDGMQVDTLEEQYRGPFDGHIAEMHFMRNTCVIIKRKQ
jgi:hypothetical protein